MLKRLIWVPFVCCLAVPVFASGKSHRLKGSSCPQSLESLGTKLELSPSLFRFINLAGQRELQSWAAIITHLRRVLDERLGKHLGTELGATTQEIDSIVGGHGLFSLRQKWKILELLVLTSKSPQSDLDLSDAELGQLHDGILKAEPSLEPSILSPADLQAAKAELNKRFMEEQRMLSALEKKHHMDIDAIGKLIGDDAVGLLSSDASRRFFPIREQEEAQRLQTLYSEAQADKEAFLKKYNPRAAVSVSNSDRIRIIMNTLKDGGVPSGVLKAMLGTLAGNGAFHRTLTQGYGRSFGEKEIATFLEYFKPSGLDLSRSSPEEYLQYYRRTEPPNAEQKEAIRKAQLEKAIAYIRILRDTHGVQNSAIAIRLGIMDRSIIFQLHKFGAAPNLSAKHLDALTKSADAYVSDPEGELATFSRK